MTTTVKVHVNGRYRATVKQDDREHTVIVEGNYEGSSNPSGEKSFHLPHPASGKFDITEEYIGDAPAA